MKCFLDYSLPFKLRDSLQCPSLFKSEFKMPPNFRCGWRLWCFVRFWWVRLILVLPSKSPFSTHYSFYIPHTSHWSYAHSSNTRPSHINISFRNNFYQIFDQWWSKVTVFNSYPYFISSCTDPSCCGDCLRWTSVFGDPSIFAVGSCCSLFYFHYLFDYKLLYCKTKKSF